MSQSSKTSIFYDSSPTEILDRQIEQFRHNQKIALRFVIGIGVTGGISLVSSVISLLFTLPNISSVFPLEFDSTSELAEIVNVLLGAMFSLISLILAVVALNQFWQMMSTSKPVPLLGKQPYRAKQIKLVQAEYATEIETYVAENSRLLFNQNQKLSRGYILGTFAVLLILLGLVYFVASRALPPYQLGRLDFFTSLMMVGVAISSITRYLSGVVLGGLTGHISWFFSSSDSDLWTPSIILASIFCAIFGFLAFYLVLFYGLSWWHQNPEAHIQIPIFGSNLLLATVVVSLLFGFTHSVISGVTSYMSKENEN